MEKVKFNKKTAHQSYKTKDGTPVPGTSTISKIHSPQEGLYYWYWNNGKKGLDFKKPLDEAADIGTLAHFLIHCFLEGKEPDLSEFSPNNLQAAQGVFNKFLELWEQEGLEFIAGEFSLVSENHKFGGTVDLKCKDQKGRICILDYKTNKRQVYPNHLIQLSAYCELNAEHNEREERRAVCRINKENPTEDFELRWLPPLDKYFQCFLANLNTYNTHKHAGI